MDNQSFFVFLKSSAAHGNKRTISELRLTFHPQMDSKGNMGRRWRRIDRAEICSRSRTKSDPESYVIEKNNGE